MRDPYKALDFYNVEDLYTEEDRLIRDTVRSWVSDRFMPVIEEHNRAATFPRELIPELAPLPSEPSACFDEAVAVGPSIEEQPGSGASVWQPLSG